MSTVLMISVRFIALLSAILLNNSIESSEISFRGTVADFKKHFGDCEFTKKVDVAPNFENYIFELAFKKGDLPVARWFIQHGGNLHKIYTGEYKNYNDTGSAPLIAAVENDHIATVNLLLTMGASPNGVKCPNAMECKHESGPGNSFLCKNMQPVPLALYKRHNAIAKLLIASGAERCWTYEEKSAVNGGNSEIIETLAIEINSRNSLHSAVHQNNPLLVQTVLKHLSPHLKKYPDSDYDGDNYSSLVVESILNNNPTITQMLLDAQPTVNVNFVSRSFRGPVTRPIIASVQKGNLVQVKDLIKRGAWINPVFPKESLIEYDSIELNPLYAAANADNIEAVEFLLHEGANPTHLARYHGAGWSEPKPVLEFIKQLQGWEKYPGFKQRPNLNRIIQILEDHRAASSHAEKP